MVLLARELVGIERAETREDGRSSRIEGREHESGRLSTPQSASARRAEEENGAWIGRATASRGCSMSLGIWEPRESV